MASPTARDAIASRAQSRRPGDDERDGEHGSREQDALALRVHRTGEQHRSRHEAPAGPVAEPQGEAAGPQPRRRRPRACPPGAPAAARRSAARRGRAGGTARGATAGAWRWSSPAIAATAPTTRNQNCTCRVTTSAPPIAWNAAASRIGCRGGYVGVRRRREHVLVEAPKKKIALPFGTQNAHASYAWRLWSRAARNRASRKSPVRAMPAAETSSIGVPRGSATTARDRRPAEQPDGDTGHSEGDERHHDLEPAERDTRGKERRPDDSERGDAEQVPEPGEPQDGAPRAEASDSPEEREPDEDVREVQRREPGERAHVTSDVSGSQALPPRPPRPEPRPGTRSDRTRSRGSTAASGFVRRGSRKYRM